MFIIVLMDVCTVFGSSNNNNNNNKDKLRKCWKMSDKY